MIGIGSSVLHPEASRITSLASGGRRGLAQSLFQVGGNLGGSLGPLLVALLVAPYGRTHIALVRGRQESVWQNACVPWLEGAEAGHAGVTPDCKPIDTVCLLQTICIKANRIYSIYVPKSELFKL